MAKIRYICEDNGHEFVGNDFSNECPTCGSSIRPISSGSGLEFISKTKDFIANNKLVVGGVLLLILLLLFFGNMDSCNKDKKVYKIEINQIDNKPYLEIDIFFKDPQSNKNNKIEPRDVLSIIEDKVNISGSDKVYRIKDNNRLYLCEDDTSEAIYFVFKNKPKITLKNSTALSKFILNGLPASPLAICSGLKITSSEIIVESIKDCKLKISFTKDIKGHKIFVSINGKNGQYVANKFIWDRKDLINTKQNVWIYIEGEDANSAVQALTNGVKISEAGCVSIDKSIIVQQFIQLANEFGKDPENRTAQVAFQKFVESNFSQTIIYLGDELLDDLASLQNKMKVVASNDGKSFEINGTPVISSDNTTIKFRFQEIK